MLQQLAADMDVLCVAEPASLADGDTIVALHRQLERLAAVVARADAAFEAGRDWQADGARSAAAWISVRCRQPLTDARRRVRLGRDLRAMPATEEAWLAGEVGEAHVEPLAGVRRQVGGEMFDPDEAKLVEHARSLNYRDFRRVLAYWVQAADPDGAERDAQAQRDARRLHVSQSIDGMWFLDGVLDPISGEAVAGALRSIANELFETDWAKAKARRGDDVYVADLARTPTQRRADALVGMARRALAAPPGARLPEPLISVLVGYETFAGRICELAGGTVVTPGSLLPWLTKAYVERVVFGGPDRVKNVGVRRRLFAGATRRAVEVCDRQCYSSSATSPPPSVRSTTSSPTARAGSPSTTTAGPPAPHHNRHRREPDDPPPGLRPK